mmetsp:Transcript_4823/g.10598  ORF Transcript_4823/g.10598 Transcript_4823/m.10598 type:complete len:281 (+) Transcript_4823:200-1042(+)
MLFGSPEISEGAPSYSPFACIPSCPMSSWVWVSSPWRRSSRASTKFRDSWVACLDWAASSSRTLLCACSLAVTSFCSAAVVSVRRRRSPSIRALASASKASLSASKTCACSSRLSSSICWTSSWTASASTRCNASVRAFLSSASASSVRLSSCWQKSWTAAMAAETSETEFLTSSSEARHAASPVSRIWISFSKATLNCFVSPRISSRTPLIAAASARAWDFAAKVAVSAAAACSPDTASIARCIAATLLWTRFSWAPSPSTSALFLRCSWVTSSLVRSN